MEQGTELPRCRMPAINLDVERFPGVRRGIGWLGRLFVKGEWSHERRTPINLFKTVAECDVRQRSAFGLLLPPSGEVFAYSWVYCVANLERPQLEHHFCCMVQIGIGVVVLEIHRDRRERVEGFFVRREKIGRSLESVGKHTRTTR